MRRPPLARVEAQAVLLVELYRRERGVGPTWGEVARALRLTRNEGRRLILRLSRRGLLSFEPNVRGSLAATRGGVAAAVETARAAKGARK